MTENQNKTPFRSPVKRPGSQDIRVAGSTESPIKSRLTSSFWKKAKVEKDTPCKESPESSESKIIKIKDIQYGLHSDQTVVFRVSLLGTLKQGQSSYLKFHALDETGEVAVIAFEKAPDCAKLLKMNGVYKLTGFDVRHESSEYRQHTTSQFQLKVLSESKLEEVSSGNFHAIPFNFVALADILAGKFDIDSRIDAVGIITEEWGLEETATGKTKRDIRITDETKNEVILTLWGDAATSFVGVQGSVIAIRKALVKQYNNHRLLNASGYTLVWVNPALENGKAQELSDWYQSEIAMLAMEDNE